jgi:hypothetical protein
VREQRGHQISDRRVEVGGRDDGLRQPQLAGFGRANHPGGQAHFDRPWQAHNVDKWLCPGQIRDQAERRFLHTEHGVVGEDPQIAGQSELEAGAQGVPAHRRDRDDVRPVQPQEPRLQSGQPLPEIRAERIGERVLPRHAVRGEQPQVDPGREGRAVPADHDRPDLCGQRFADGREGPPHAGSHRVAPFGTVQRHRGHRAVDVEPEPYRRRVSGTRRPRLHRRVRVQRFDDDLLPRVAPPRPRSLTPVSLSIRCTKPYERPVEAARDRMLSPAS